MLRPIIVDGDVALIQLTKGYTATIDAEDIYLVEGRSWQAQENRRKDGSVYKVYGIRTPKLGKIQYLHRLILPTPYGYEVDHKDGNGLNCRKYNLRVATGQQNRQNRSICNRNTSGFKGVIWCKRDKKYIARIKCDGKQKYLGYFDNVEEAAEAYAKASLKYHGEFGRVN